MELNIVKPEMLKKHGIKKKNSISYKIKRKAIITKEKFNSNFKPCIVKNPHS